MMKNTKKPYIAPTAEPILLAPLEALANQTLSTGDDIALRNWGKKTVISNASVIGDKQTYWGDDGFKK